MELRRYAAILWRWLWLILLGTCLAGATSYLVSISMPRIYEASTTLLVNQTQNPGTVAYNDVLTNERLTKTYGELIRKRPILESTVSELKLPYSAEQLDRMLGVRVVRDTMLLELKVENQDPQLAADIANSIAHAFIEANRQNQMGQASTSRDALKEQLQSLQRDIQSTSSQLDQLRTASDGRTPEARQAEIARLQNTLSQYQLTYSQLLKSDQDMRLSEAKAFSTVTVAEPAQAEYVPIKPKVAQNVLLAALVGLMLACGVALLIEYLDDTVKSSDDVSRTLGAPTLGYIVRLKGDQAKELMGLILKNPRSPIVEAFRVLRTNLQFSLLDNPGKTILVTSSAPGEGKTTTAVNLAMVMAQSGHRVILVDADLHRPSVHRYFGMKNDAGLTTALLEPGFLGASTLLPSGVDNLVVMPSGPIPPNPSELLGSARMSGLVGTLKGLADVVLFDGPPALAVTDPSVLARMADGVLIVVDSGRTRAEALVRTRETLERAAGSGRILGAVLNKLSMRTAGYSYYYYHYGYGDENKTNGNGNGSEKNGSSTNGRVHRHRSGSRPAGSPPSSGGSA